MNNVLYERELALMKNDFIKDGNTSDKWRAMEICSFNTLLYCGFKSAYEVRRAADRWGKRVFK